MRTNVKLSKIQPASYNPRYLSDEAFEQLKASIKRLGCIKPIIVREENNTIIAGHQRTKAMKAVGKKTAQAYIINNVGKQDEVRFNQMHNMSEIAIMDAQPKLKILVDIPEGESVEIQPKQIKIEDPGEIGSVIASISSLILKYGSFANCIVGHDNQVIISAAYAMASKLLNKPIFAYQLKKEDVEFAQNAFAVDYGVFSYDHVPKDVFIQSMAQKHRRGETANGNSRLYDHAVIPNIKKEDRVLDFGAGWQDYAKRLNREGYNIFPLEFYLKRHGTLIIDTDAVEKDFIKIVEDVTENGLFDCVVCDSVLNSVHSLEAEKYVLTVLNAFCKKGGKIFWSGRPIRDASALLKKLGTGNMNKKNNSNIKYIDKDGFTGNFRNGRWFYQKFHTQDQIEKLHKTYISKEMEKTEASSSFQCIGVKDFVLSPTVLKKALKYEFSLPLPTGKPYRFYNSYSDFFNLILKLNKK